MLPMFLLFPSMIVNRSVSLDTILVLKGAMERENHCAKCPVLQPGTGAYFPNHSHKICRSLAGWAHSLIL